MGFVSYAQNNEDVLLHRVFGGQETGFYVDVGAYHPTEGSVTKALYDRGWSGINIEPGSIFEELAAARPRDVNLRMAVLDRQGSVSFVEDPRDRGMSHVVDVGANSLESVPCDTLENLVRDHGRGRPVDLVKVDAEGAEESIVRSTDWRRLRPRLLVIEATLPWSNVLSNQAWEPILFEQGYVRTFFDGINCFYVPEEEAQNLTRHFAVPVGVLDGVRSYELIRAKSDLSKLEGELSSARVKIEFLELLSTEIKKTDRQVATAEPRVDEWSPNILDFVSEIVDQDGLKCTLERALEAQRQVVAERDRVVAERDRIVAERDRVVADRDRIASEYEQIAQLLAAVQQQPTYTPASPPPSVPTGSAPSTLGKSRFVRRASRLVYGVVRPVVRPLAWRLRSFMTTDITARLNSVNDRLNALPAVQVNVNSQPVDWDGISGNQSSDVANAIAGQLAEMRRLSATVETAILTLAMEAAAMPEQAAGVGAEPPPHDAMEVPIRLPRERSARLFSRSGDLSVSASLISSDGLWEPHVQRFFETVVGADSICMDIGANIGAHTLGLAVLADQGHVIAFEADPENYALLRRNGETLDFPKGRIEIVHVALWDSPGSLTIGGADELAGCSFVTDKPTDATATEQKLRSVVAGGAIAETELHLRLAAVTAMRLDDWIAANPPARLDLIKLDVEGAEVFVLRGARDTIQRFQPKLLVEYNPACAQVYFDQARDALYLELASQFPHIFLLEEDGSLTPLSDWETLRARLEVGRGWEDLVCSHVSLN